MNLVPLEANVILKVEEAKEKSPGGIYFPTSEKVNRGVVQAVGPGRLLENGERISPSVKEGDKVVFHWHMGTEVDCDGEQYLVVPEQSLIAICC